MILLHGRGASARDIIALVPELDVPDNPVYPGFAYLAPQAAESTWYPNSFLAPTASNEPWLSSALAVVGNTIATVEAAGISPHHIILLGFSQGACLTLEYSARNARRYGGVVGLSGGLIGAEGENRQYSGSLAGTPVFLGCSDVDFHIPKERVQQTAERLRTIGGGVTMRLYPNLGHTTNQDEINFVREMMASLIESTSG